MPLRRVARYLEQQMFAYNLTTGLYMLEPWERAVFNAAVVAVVGTTSFYAYSWLRPYLA